jgi:uncharacterized protein (TIGR02145 family)
MMYKNIFVVIGTVVMLFFTGCSSPDTFTDPRDGKSYKTVQIGKQVWMAENLQATQYRDGTPIPMLMDNKDWIADTSGAYCYSNHSYKMAKTYGMLYNGAAILNPRKLAPAGWHIPSDSEWQTLVDYLGGEKEAGGKLKEADDKLWNENTGATNESGFSALPAGSRECHALITGVTSSYEWIGLRAFFASSTEWGNKIVWVRDLQNLNASVNRAHGGGHNGISVRCVKD